MSRNKRHTSRHKAIEIHAERRAKDRFGIRLTDELRKKIKGMIRRKEIRPNSRLYKNRRQYPLTLNGQSMTLVYDHLYDTVVTLIPNGSNK